MWGIEQEDQNTKRQYDDNEAGCWSFLFVAVAVAVCRCHPKYTRYIHTHYLDYLG